MDQEKENVLPLAWGLRLLSKSLLVVGVTAVIQLSVPNLLSLFCSVLIYFMLCFLIFLLSNCWIESMVPFENMLFTADKGSFVGSTWLVFVWCAIFPAGKVRKVSFAGCSCWLLLPEVCSLLTHLFPPREPSLAPPHALSAWGSLYMWLPSLCSPQKVLSPFLSPLYLYFAGSNLTLLSPHGYLSELAFF